MASKKQVNQRAAAGKASYGKRLEELIKALGNEDAAREQVKREQSAIGKLGGRPTFLESIGKPDESAAKRRAEARQEFVTNGGIISPEKCIIRAEKVNTAVNRKVTGSNPVWGAKEQSAKIASSPKDQLFPPSLSTILAKSDGPEAVNELKSVTESSPKNGKNQGSKKPKKPVKKAIERAISADSQAQPRSKSVGRLQNNGVTLEQSLEMCVLYHVNRGDKESTLKWYRKEVSPFIRFLRENHGPLLFSELTYQDVSAYMGHMKQSGRAHDSIRTRLGAIRAFVNNGADGWLGVDCQQIDPREVQLVNRHKLPRHSSLPKGFFSRQDFDSMLALCPETTFLGSRRRAMLHLLISIGIRKNELHKLKAEDIKMRERKVYVMEAKHNQPRRVPLHDDAHQSILRYLSQRQDNLPWLWVTRSGPEAKQLGYHSLGQDLTRLAERAGIPPERRQDICHIFRRTFAIWAERQGMTRTEIMQIGGWKTESMVARYIKAASLDEESIHDRYLREYKLFGGA